MKILIDVSAGQAIADALSRLGHEVLSVRDRDPAMPDIDILAWAATEQRLVVTMDKDFGELVHHSGLPHAGVLLLRIETLRTAAKVEIVSAIFRDHENELPGKFAVYQSGRLRVR